MTAMESTLITGMKVGKTRITGRCVGISPSTGNEIVFSEDSVDVHVVAIEGIKIRTPLTRIKSGAVMPAVIWGSPDLSPMVLGTLQNMKIIWSTNQPDVVDIYNIFSEAGELVFFFFLVFQTGILDTKLIGNLRLTFTYCPKSIMLSDDHKRLSFCLRTDTEQTVFQQIFLILILLDYDSILVFFSIK